MCCSIPECYRSIITMTVLTNAGKTQELATVCVKCTVLSTIPCTLLSIIQEGVLLFLTILVVCLTQI